MSSNSNENNGASSLQRFLIGGGTLLVVVLTLIGAILLAMQDSPEQATPLAQISPTPTFPPATPAPTFTNTPIPLPPGDTSTATATTVPVELTPSATFTPVPAPATDTPAAAPATDTPAAAPPTATPLPPPAPQTTAATDGGVCQKPASWVDYQVQVGDTLNSLAQRTNTTVFDLQQVNCLEPATVTPGQIIYLPFLPPTPTPTNTPGPTSTIRPTDTRTPTVTAPIIDRMVPSNVSAETAKNSIQVTVFGRNFDSRSQLFRAELNGPQFIQLEIVPNSGSTTSFDAIIPVTDPAGLPVGAYDLVVTNIHDRAGFKAAAFTVGDPPTPTPTVPPPFISQIIPAEEYLNDLLSSDRDLTILGDNFEPNDPAFMVELQFGSEPRIPLEVLLPGTDTNFKARINAGEVTKAGNYFLFVTNPDNRTDSRSFLILSGSRP